MKLLYNETIVVTILTSFATLLQCPPANARDSGRLGNSPLTSDIRVRLSSTPDTIRGDPVVITVETTSTGDDAVSILTPQIRLPEFLTAGVRLKPPRADKASWVMRPGLFQDSICMLRRTYPDVAVQTTDPGKTIHSNILIDWDSSKASGPLWLFSDLGNYEVELNVCILEKPVSVKTTVVPGDTKYLNVEADPVIVHIVDPVDKKDIEAVKSLFALKEGWMFYKPIQVPLDLPEELVQFRKKHADSRYFPFTEPAVIVSEFWHAGKNKDKAAAQKIYERAVALAKSAEKWPPGWRAVAEELVTDLKGRLDSPGW